MDSVTIQLAHGSGGRATWDLITGIFYRHFESIGLQVDSDAAVLDFNGRELAFTTDGFVVDPLFFPGGNLGTLAVNGTCNDLTVVGAKPLWLTCGFIIGAGTPWATVEEIARAMARAAELTGVRIVAGDTKVVESTGNPTIHITASGVGEVVADPPWAMKRIGDGDVLIISGTIGEHTLAVLGARHGWSGASGIASDCAALHPLLEPLFPLPGVHLARDVTRGGLSGVCWEVVNTTGLSIELEESHIPVSPEVQGRCELLGFDPLTLANEGKALLAVPEEVVPSVLKILQSHPLGKRAAVIGRARSLRSPGSVIMNTAVGGCRLVPIPTGTLFPRIC